jgi:hypothetical protein
LQHSDQARKQRATLGSETQCHDCLFPCVGVFVIQRSLQQVRALRLSGRHGPETEACGRENKKSPSQHHESHPLIDYGDMEDLGVQQSSADWKRSHKQYGSSRGVFADPVDHRPSDIANRRALGALRLTQHDMIVTTRTAR